MMRLNKWVSHRVWTVWFFSHTQDNKKPHNMKEVEFTCEHTHTPVKDALGGTPDISKPEFQVLSPGFTTVAVIFIVTVLTGYRRSVTVTHKRGGELFWQLLYAIPSSPMTNVFNTTVQLQIKILSSFCRSLMLCQAVRLKNAQNNTAKQARYHRNYSVLSDMALFAFHIIS